MNNKSANNEPELKELYIGCGCGGLDHLARFSHHPLTQKEKDEGEEDPVYITVRTENYFTRIVPSIKYIFEKYTWQDFFYYNWFKRVIIGFRHIKNPFYSILESPLLFSYFEFQKKDLPEIYEMMSSISLDTSDIKPLFGIDKEFYVDLSNDNLVMRISIDKDLNEEDMLTLAWRTYFIHGKTIKRIKDDFKYIFGGFSDEQCFEIFEREAVNIKEMIKLAQKENELDEERKKRDEETRTSTK